MMSENFKKYEAYKPIKMKNRKWLTIYLKAPDLVFGRFKRWQSSLVEPMDSSRKMRMFKALVNMGFKEIEVGFPSASETDTTF